EQRVVEGEAADETPHHVGAQPVGHDRHQQRRAGSRLAQQSCGRDGDAADEQNRDEDGQAPASHARLASSRPAASGVGPCSLREGTVRTETRCGLGPATDGRMPDGRRSTFPSDWERPAESLPWRLRPPRWPPESQQIIDTAEEFSYYLLMAVARSRRP